MEMPDGMKKGAARIWNAMNRPVLRSSSSLDCKIYDDESAHEPRASFGTSCSHSIKLVDLIIGAAALTVFICTMHKMSKSMKK